MENHVFKPHYRHGHHHHKNQLFYALLSMVFFALIAAGVVASIYYSLGGENRGQETTSNNGAAGTCLVGTVDCTDTPNDSSFSPNPYDDRIALRQAEAQEDTAFYSADAGYEIIVPAGMQVRGFSEFDISLSYPESKWNLALTVAPNANNATLEEAFQNLLAERAPSEFGEYTAEDIKTSNIRLDGIQARRFSINNYGDVGETVIVAINKGYIYVISGSTGQDWNNEDTDVLNFAASFKFLD